MYSRTTTSDRSVMKEQSFYMPSAAGGQLFGKIWQPTEEPKAIIILIHGFGEHCSRYSSYINFFKNAGFAFIGMDHIGHGQSDGKRGVIKSYEQLLKDVEHLMGKANETWPQIPKIIYGHSMGGNIALNYLLQKPRELIGGIISSPWLKLKHEPNAISKLLIKLLGSICPDTTIRSGINANHISTQKHQVEAYRGDPLNHGRISFRLLREITKQGLWAIKSIKELQTPVLLIHGSHDPITSCEASRQLARLNTQQISYQEMSDVYHEVHNDTQREQLAKLCSKWIDQLLSAAEN